MKLTQSDNESVLNVDVVEAVAAAGDVSTHVGFEIQFLLYHTDEARQREVLHQDVRLTHIYQEAEAVEGLSTERGLAQGHQHGQLLDHLLCLLLTTIVTIIITVAAAVQDLDLHQGCLGRGDRLAVLYRLLEGDSAGVGGDQFPVVIDPDPARALDLSAHPRPGDIERPPRRHHRAFRCHHRQDTAQEREGLPPTHDRGQILGLVMIGEVARAEDLGDQPHFIHRTIEEFHGLMLLRTVLHETTVSHERTVSPETTVV